MVIYCDTVVDAVVMHCNTVVDTGGIHCNTVVDAVVNTVGIHRNTVVDTVVLKYTYLILFGFVAYGANVVVQLNANVFNFF